MNRLLFVFFLVLTVSLAYGDDTICPVTADNSIAAHNSELTENSGSSKRIKIKGSENYPVLKFDLSKIPSDANIEKAELTLQLTNPKMCIRQIGYSTIPVDWTEGSGSSEKDHKFSCYLGANGPESGWGRKDFHYQHVISGNAGNVSGALLAEKVGETYKLTLPGRVIAAMKKDQIGGLTLSDESGWWGGGEFSNIYFHSREAGAQGPQLKVFWSKSTDKTAPSAPSLKQVETLPTDGEVLLEITCGGNDGAKGIALGYDVRYAEGESLEWDKATELNRMYIPRPFESGVVFRHLLRDLKPGTKYTIGFKAYDEAGNTSEIAKVVVTAEKSPAIPKPTPEQFTFEVGGPLATEGLLNICAVDELSKIDPVTGKILIGDKFEEPKYINGNFTWDGKNKAVTLQGAKGEAVCFQLVLENISGKAISSIAFKAGDLAFDKNTIPAKSYRFLREWYLNKDNEWYSHALPILEDKNNGVLQLPYTDNAIPNQKFLALYVELFVPYQASAGKYSGSIKVIADGKEISVPVNLSVLDYEMPKSLSFYIELNAYGINNKDQFNNVHRLAHLFRTGYNTLSYGHSGKSSTPFVPPVKGLGKEAVVTDWSVWDEWMDPVLSGKLFEDLPRGPVPIPHFYMPFFENYPMPVSEYMEGKIHAKRKELGKKELADPYMSENDVLVADGFSQAWKDGVFTIGQAYRKHFEEKGWFNTEFQLFCNNKVFKGESSLWTLDEPTFGRDFRALNFLGAQFLKPFEGSKLKVVSRADISRPAAQGNRVDQGVNLTVMSGGFYGEHRHISKRMKELGERYWIYGGGRGQNTDPSQLLATYIKMWRFGCDGGLAYWTSFSGSTWNDFNDLAVVLKGEQGYKSKPTASYSLAIQRRSQQEIELMILLSKKKGWNRQMVSEYVASAVSLASVTTSKNAEDPGSIKFSGVSAEQLIRLRMSLQQELLK